MPWQFILIIENLFLFVINKISIIKSSIYNLKPKIKEKYLDIFWKISLIKR